MFDDLDPLDRMMSSDPADSAHANGARLSWRAGDGVYADTFGRLQFTAPQAPYSSDNAALAALVDAVTAQVAAMDEASRIALFANLKRDKQNDLKGAGIVFTTAAGGRSMIRKTARNCAVLRKASCRNGPAHRPKRATNTALPTRNVCVYTPASPICQRFQLQIRRWPLRTGRRASNRDHSLKR
jgi:hypothetical protein